MEVFFMKWNTEKSSNPVTTPQIALDGIIAERLRLYERLGWVSEVSEEDISALIADAKATEQRILDAGLNPKPHGVYRIGIIPACCRPLYPQTLRRTLRDLLGQTGYDSWGYVNSDYYGKPDEEKDIPNGFTEADIGKVFFLVEDEDAPGRNPDMPGSLLANMCWGEERDSAWKEWAAKYQNAGTVRSLNYATHGLIWLGDTADWYNALGRIGCYDYIEQPYDIRRSLCPCGSVDGSGADWRADRAGALSDCAAAAVVW
jgi:hypothetical protein